MFIIPLFIILLLGFVTCFKYAAVNLTVIQHDWQLPAVDKLLLLLKSLGWLVLGLLAAGGLLQAIVESQT